MGHEFALSKECAVCVIVKVMKQFLSLSVLAILAIGALGLAAGVTPEPGDSLTVNSSSNRASDSEKERLYWKPLDGPYERVTYALAFVPGAKQYTLHAGTWGHGVYFDILYYKYL